MHRATAKDVGELGAVSLQTVKLLADAHEEALESTYRSDAFDLMEVAHYGQVCKDENQSWKRVLKRTVRVDWLLVRKETSE